MGIPPVLDTVHSGCSHNFIFDRLVLSIVHDILAVYQTHDSTMVLTAAQTTAFFKHVDQMGIPHVTVLQLQAEGITLVSDLADFNKDSLQQLTDNLRCPGGRVLDPNPTAQPGSTIPTPPFVFGAKSQRHIAVACNLVNYYNSRLRTYSSQPSVEHRNEELRYPMDRLKREERRRLS